MSRRGQTRRTADERIEQLAQLLAAKPHTVAELARAMACTDGLVRYYLKRLGSAVRREATAQPGQRSVLQFSWAEETGAS